MHQTHLSTGCATRVPSKPRLLGWVSVLAAFVLLVTMAACAGSQRRAATSPQARAVLLHNIAASYAQNGDLTAAKAAITALNLANPAQLLISQAEDAARQGAATEEVEALSNLAGELGARSSVVMAYLEPAPAEESPTQEPTEAPPPPTNTAAPSPTELPPTATPTASPTVAAASATEAPTGQATASASGKPRVSARDDANLRAGPGTNYPTIGQLQAGTALNIMGRNQSGDWWRVAYPSEDQAWVSGLLVEVSGPIDTVAVVKNIPAAPRVPTQAPAPAQAPAATQAPASAPAPTAAPSLPAGMQYAVKSLRLRSLTEGQSCGGGNHNLVATVVDAAGNAIDGVGVREIWTNTTLMSGSKGPGGVEFVTGKGGGGQLVLVDGAGNEISPKTRGMSNDFPDFDLMWQAGYCSCESLDEAACQAAIAQAQANPNNPVKRFAQGHYVFEVIFQRAS